MGKGDIVKIEMQYGGIVIGIIDSITVNDILFKMYYYRNELYVYIGLARNYKMLNITPEEIDLFKDKLLSQGYSYDDETKTVIHEL